MNMWVEQVLNPFMEEERDNMSPYDNSLLMLDNFSVHCTLETSLNIAKSKTRMLLLPPNTTSKTQVLDVGINKPFKAGIRKLFIKYLADEFRMQFDNLDEDSVFKIDYSKIKRSTLSKWISEVWKDCARIPIERTLRNIGYLTN